MDSIDPDFCWNKKIMILILHKNTHKTKLTCVWSRFCSIYFSCYVSNQWFSMRDVCTSILLHMMKFDNVFKYNLIKILRLEQEHVQCLFLLMLFIMHCCIIDTLPKITKFWQNFFAVLMPSYLTFVTAKVKIILLSRYFS